MDDEDRDGMRGQPAGFDRASGEVTGSGAGAGRGNPGEDHDEDAANGDGQGRAGDPERTLGRTPLPPD